MNGLEGVHDGLVGRQGRCRPFRQGPALLYSLFVVDLYLLCAYHPRLNLIRNHNLLVRRSPFTFRLLTHCCRVRRVTSHDLVKQRLLAEVRHDCAFSVAVEQPEREKLLVVVVLTLDTLILIAAIGSFAQTLMMAWATSGDQRAVRSNVADGGWRMRGCESGGRCAGKQMGQDAELSNCLCEKHTHRRRKGRSVAVLVRVTWEVGDTIPHGVEVARDALAPLLSQLGLPRLDIAHAQVTGLECSATHGAIAVDVQRPADSRVVRQWGAYASSGGGCDEAVR